MNQAYIQIILLDQIHIPSIFLFIGMVLALFVFITGFRLLGFYLGLYEFDDQEETQKSSRDTEKPKKAIIMLKLVKGIDGKKKEEDEDPTGSTKTAASA